MTSPVLIAAALALSACAAPPLDVTGTDVSPPPLDPFNSIAVVLHMESPGDFAEAKAAHSIAIAHAFATRGNPCEIFMRLDDATPARWTDFGRGLHHELAHCEGWPADHPADWHVHGAMHPTNPTKEDTQ